MRLTGEANWWAPGPLRRWQLRHGWREPAALPFPTLADAGGHREEAVAAVLGHPCFDRARPALAAVVARHVELAPTPAPLVERPRPRPGGGEGSAVRSAAGLVEAMLAPGAAFGAELLDGGTSPATVVAGSDALLAVGGGPHLRAIDRAFRLSREQHPAASPPPCPRRTAGTGCGRCCGDGLTRPTGTPIAVRAGVAYRCRPVHAVHAIHAADAADATDAVALYESLRARPWLRRFASRCPG
ncbi:MAG: hypothetical protein R2749_27975 [Acidimicrobiales bacterium]